MKVGIVANEPSGDLLGASVVRELKARVPNLLCVGVAGPQMQAAGCETLLPQERLSVMGLAEVIKHLPTLLLARHKLMRYFLSWRPDVFIGVDAPDFNLVLERKLRRSGILTVHMVSPTIWAWRPGRVKGLRAAVDLLLSIFPFEEPLLLQQGVRARYVGHPMADEIPLQVDRETARMALELPPEGPVIALLPGSRVSEVTSLSEPFLQTAAWCLARRPELSFAVPLLTPRLREIFTVTHARVTPRLPVRMLDGRSREIIAASDCVLTASGTATLEALLLKRPMVVAYHINQLTFHLIKALNLIKVPHVAMANLLAGRELAPEFLQDRCRAELLGPALLAFLDDPTRVADIRAIYGRIHNHLRRNAGREAAAAVLNLMAGRHA
jgi:lipid-A-disaccharide synthase